MDPHPLDILPITLYVSSKEQKYNSSLWQHGRHSLAVALQEKSHNLTRQTLAEKLDQMAIVNSKESIFLLWSIPELEVLETLHIGIPVKFMEKMKGYEQLDILSNWTLST